MTHDLWPPEKVLETLRKYMLVDGFDMVLDLQKSEGSWLYDRKSDKKYLDFFSFFASAPVGFNHPALWEKEFQQKLSFAAVNKVSNSDFYTQEMAEFVEAFARYAKPSWAKYMFFISGGALAVENALKTAFDWKVRLNFAKGAENERGSQVIHFKEAFHGRSGYTLSLTNTADPRKYMYFPKFDWPRIDNPKIIFPLDEHLEEVKKAEEKSIQQIEDAFEKYGDDIAAIIIEPIQGEGGDNHFRPEFFKALRKIANEHEAMLIYDEVQTGIGITGAMWAHYHFPGAEPDIISFGKKTQVCGILSSSRVDEVENNVFHESSRINSTWGGNLVDMVRSAKYLEIIHEEQLVENAKKQGEYLLSRLHDLSEDLNQKITNIRGKGLFVAFDLETSELRDTFKKNLLDNGVIILGCGHRSIRFRPPLNISRDELDLGLSKIEETLRAL